MVFVPTLVALMLLTACGGSSSHNDASNVSVDKLLAAKVPADIKSTGRLIVGTDPGYPPAEFLDSDGKTVVGFAADLMRSVSAKLGLKTEFVPSKFGDILAGVQSDKYQVGMSSFTINDERKSQAVMVSYFSAGTQWATKKGNSAHVDPNNACGKKIAVEKDTVEVPDITARSKKCTDSGKTAIAIDQYQGQEQATSAVISGKDDAMLADSPVVSYAAKQSRGELAGLGPIYQSAPYGFVLRKNQSEFASVVRDALVELIKDGGYAKILAKWGVQSGSISQPAINP